MTSGEPSGRTANASTRGTEGLASTYELVTEPWPGDRCIRCEELAVVTTVAVDLRYTINYSPMCIECVDEPWD